MTAAAADTAALVTRAGVARTLLPIHFLRGTSHHAARLRLMRTLPHVRLIHHDRVVQQLLVDARSEISGLDVVRPHFLSFAIVNGKLGHDRFEFVR